MNSIDFIGKIQSKSTDVLIAWAHQVPISFLFLPTALGKLMQQVYGLDLHQAFPFTQLLLTVYAYLAQHFSQNKKLMHHDCKEWCFL